MKSLFRKKKIYADYAAGTPLDADVLKIMTRHFSSEGYGNPASIHSFGRIAKEAVEVSRKKIALMLQTQPDEIIFTSGGTESNNLALHGVLSATPVKYPHVITSVIEHSSILEPLRALEGKGVRVTHLPVDKGGRVNKIELEKMITEDTVLVSLAYANGEIGTVEKIREVGNIIKLFKEKQPIYFHTDATQAVNYLRVMPHDLHVDLLTLDASKCYVPKGVGLLYVKRGTPLTPLARGGGQERGVRSGTENVSSILGFAKALEKVELLREKEKERLEELRNTLRDRLLKEIPGTLINGEGAVLSNFLNICLPDTDAEFFSVKLDKEGVAVSSASACRSISGAGSSYVIESLPERSGCGKSSLRITLGRDTAPRDINFIAETIVRLSQFKK